MSARIAVDKSLIEFAIWALRESNYLECADALAAALSAEPGEAEGWQPIETAPFDKLVDLWCIQGYEREATWPVRGSLVGGRHKTKDYGWFGNQSKDGVPQKDAPDLVPVAWRPVNVPTDLVAKFLCPAGRTALEDKP
jgi:hypothetical protein